jgi:predicted O-linked N-acetylglucosamine transferase (SPINDLY family)
MAKVGGPARELAQCLRDAVRHHEAGRLDRARPLYERALRADPKCARALNGLGLIEQSRGHAARAVELLRAAIAAKPSAIYHNNLANSLRALGVAAPAEDAYREALRLDPSYAKAHYNLGAFLAERGRAVEAAACFERALGVEPGFAAASAALAALLARGDRSADAEAVLRRGLAANPVATDLVFALGELLRRQGRHPEAIACFERLVGLNPSDAAAFNNLGALYQLEGRVDAALLCLERAAELEPESAHTRFNLARLLDDLGRFDDALAAYQAALAKPSPLDLELRCHLAVLRRRLCDFRGEAEAHADLVARIDAFLSAPAERGLAPLALNVIELPGALRLRVARHLARGLERETAEARAGCAFPAQHARRDAARLRIGYVSPDFRQHAVGTLIHDLFRHHDREHFETFAYSLVSTGDGFQRSVQRGVDHFADVSRESPEATAKRIHGDGIDLLVDLAGYTTYSRSAIFALRPAPVQISWLGYLDTQGSDAIRYAIADDRVVPESEAANWSETLVSLPECFAVSSRLPIATDAPSRAELGLPEGAAVFCSMNALHKLDLRTFEAWMQILARVPNGVLWLYDDTSETGRARLASEAAARGIDPSRMVFAKRAALPDYLARYRRADLFLDSFAYNAGATAVGALRAGLPVLTLPGASFMSRMGGSLVAAAGLADCVCVSADAYVERAVALGSEPERLRELRARLAAAQSTAPLFDLPRFARQLEAAYQAIWDHAQSRDAARRIRVAERASTSDSR